MDEVRQFLHNYQQVAQNKEQYLISKTLGFLEIIDYFDNKISKEDLITKATQKTRNYAKRQLTWFRHQFKQKDLVVRELVSKDNIKKLIEQFKRS